MLYLTDKHKILNMNFQSKDIDFIWMLRFAYTSKLRSKMYFLLHNF